MSDLAAKLEHILHPESSSAPPVTAEDSPRPKTLLIHGYSDSGQAFVKWKGLLNERGIKAADIEIGNYITLNNEITIKDLGEAFDRALRLTPWSFGSKDDSWTFNAIVHSTGMLVLRQWLTADPFDRDDPRSRIQRLKHLVGLAPATFGSPQGKKGRSWLGALVKGNKDFSGPDFLNAGNLVLDGLELASKFTWDLARKDVLSDKPLYDHGSNTPYVAVFIGNSGYTGISAVANSPGTDGTIRWAGCALNSRMVQLDFLRKPILTNAAGDPVRSAISEWNPKRLDCPIIAIEGLNHGTILSDPDADTADRVADFLKNVNTEDAYADWLKSALEDRREPLANMDKESESGDWGGAGWQQFVVHVKDDHGDGVPDYNIQLYIGENLAGSDPSDRKVVPLVVDSYSTDSSYRCFYVRLNDDMLHLGEAGRPARVWMELIASSGTKYLEYEAYTHDIGKDNPNPVRLTTERNKSDSVDAVKLDLTDLGSSAKLFFPYTTTLIEITLEREPTPLAAVSDLFRFLLSS